MTSYDLTLQIGFYVLGMASVGFFVFQIVKLVFPDQELLAAQARLGVASATRKYRHWSLKFLSPFYKALVPRIQQMRMPIFRQQKKLLFVTAGVDDQFDPDEFVGLKIISAFLGPLLIFLFLSQMGKQMSLMWFLCGLGAGFFLPDYVVWDMKRRRQKGVIKELPQMMDLLTLSVEAGMDFMAAISRVIETMKSGALRDELSQVLKEIQLGTTRADALRNMADRVQLKQLSSFASILIQADEMGSPIGPVLRAQSDLLRNERFQRAEREGAKATQKLLIPLVVFILPSVFIVILGPVIVDIYYNQSWFQNIFK